MRQIDCPDATVDCDGIYLEDVALELEIEFQSFRCKYIYYSNQDSLAASPYAKSDFVQMIRQSTFFTRQSKLS